MEMQLRPGETVFELTYRSQVTGWLQVQPDFQYIIHPAGRLYSNDQLPPYNAVLFAVQTTVQF